MQADTHAGGIIVRTFISASIVPKIRPKTSPQTTVESLLHCGRLPLSSDRAFGLCHGWNEDRCTALLEVGAHSLLIFTGQPTGLPGLAFGESLIAPTGSIFL